jgi:hypothetical protein
MKILISIIAFIWFIKEIHIFDQLAYYNIVSKVQKISIIDYELEQDSSSTDFNTKSDEFIYVLEKEYDFRFPEVVYAQILHETGMLKSSIYKECNNLVGMKNAVYRHWDIGTCRGHALYRSKSDCLRDYAEYQDKYLTNYEKCVIKRDIITNEEYIEFLVYMKYAEDSSYSKKLQPYLLAIKNSSTWKM